MWAAHVAPDLRGIFSCRKTTDKTRPNKPTPWQTINVFNKRYLKQGAHNGHALNLQLKKVHHNNFQLKVDFSLSMTTFVKLRPELFSPCLWPPMQLQGPWRLLLSWSGSVGRVGIFIWGRLIVCPRHLTILWESSQYLVSQILGEKTLLPIVVCSIVYRSTPKITSTFIIFYFSEEWVFVAADFIRFVWDETLYLV